MGSMKSVVLMYPAGRPNFWLGGHLVCQNVDVGHYMENYQPHFFIPVIGTLVVTMDRYLYHFMPFPWP